MLVRSSIKELLLDQGVSVEIAENILDAISTSIPTLGCTLYVVTQYLKTFPYEVIRCVVRRTTLTRKGKKIFTVEGFYEKNSYYNANLTLSSIGKTVFFNEEDAHKKCESLNTK